MFRAQSITDSYWILGALLVSHESLPPPPNFKVVLITTVAPADLQFIILIATHIYVIHLCLAVEIEYAMCIFISYIPRCWTYVYGLTIKFANSSW